MAKYGSASIIFLVGGYNFLAPKVKQLSHKIEALQESDQGLGDAHESSAPTGVTRMTVVQQGAFFDDSENSSHDAMSSLQTSPAGVARVVCLGFEGNVIGRAFEGIAGNFQQDYEVLGENGGLTKANVTHRVQGARDQGVILHALGAETGNANTESDSVDGTAQSANGGVGYLHVTALTLGGFTSITVTIRDSADDITFADLVAFTAVTVAPAAERVTVAGTVERYVAQNIVFNGAGAGASCAYFCGFKRNP